MNRGAVAMLVAGLMITHGTATAATTLKPGSACKKAGSTSVLAGKRYTCTKTGGRLVWSKGPTAPKAVQVPGTAQPAPSSSPTPSQPAVAEWPRTGQPCPRYSPDVIGRDSRGQLVQLMCNQFDDRYFPRPNGLPVDAQTGTFDFTPVDRTLPKPDVEWTTAANAVWAAYDAAADYVPSFESTVSERANRIRAGALERSARLWSAYFKPPIVELVYFTQDDEAWLYSSTGVNAGNSRPPNWPPFGDTFCPSTTSISKRGNPILAWCVGGRWSAQEHFHGILEAHEYTHMFQMHYDAWRTGWMTEGSATFFGQVLGSARSDLVNLRAEGLGRCRGVSRDTSLLSKNESQTGPGSDLRVQYCLGSLATEYLIGKYGFSKFAEFTMHAAATDFGTNFKQTFGTTPADFYRVLQPYVDYNAWFW